MCNKTEDMIKLVGQVHHCPDCHSQFIEVLDLLDHIRETHKK